MSRHHLNIALMDFTGNIVDNQMGISYTYENTPESFDVLCGHIQDFIDRTVNSNRRFLTSISIFGSGESRIGLQLQQFLFQRTPDQ